MSSIREQIMAAIVVALNDSRPGNVPEFIRTRVDSPDPGQLPVNSVYQGEEIVGRMTDEGEGRTSRGPVLRRAVIVHIEAVTKAAGASVPDKELDPTLVWVTSKMAAAGRFAGDLADYPGDELGTRFEYERAESSFCRATMRWRIEYQTTSTDAEAMT